MTAPTLQASSIPPARKSRRTSLAARTPRTARLARAGNQASSLPSARKSRRTSLAARTPRIGTKDDSDLGAAVPDPVAAVPNEVAPVSERWRRFPIRSRRFPMRWRRFPMWSAPVSDRWRRFLMRWRRFPMWSAPVSDVSALVQDMLTSVAGAVVPLTQLQSDLYSFLLGIAGVAPVSDVIALVQDMLRSVVDAVVLLAQLPSDLFSFLLGIAGVQPVVGGVGGIHGPGLSAAAGASVASRLPLGLPLAGISGPPLPVSRACR